MSLKIKNRIYQLESDRLLLRSLQLSDKSERYLNWLNDPEVQKYSRRRGQISTMENIEEFIKSSLEGNDFHFAIFTKNNNSHIGNISLNSVDELNNHAELSIMIGDKNVWGRGYAKEAISVLLKFAFEKLNLNRVWAESCNPAFIALMNKLFWFKEGVRREAICIDGVYLDYVNWSVLKKEWLAEKI